MKKPILIVAIILLLGVFAFSAWNVVETLLEYREGEVFYEDLNQYVSIPEAEVSKDKPAQEDQTESTRPLQTQRREYPLLDVDFDALLALNPDVVGWIYIPDTSISYPVLQGQNNDQYLYHLLTGTYNGAGSIFLDSGAASDFSGKNHPIYGHNMKNGTMFAGLKGYTDQEFFDAHPKAYLMTPEKNYVVHLFSGYVIDAWGNAWDMIFSDSMFREWLDACQSRSCFVSDVVPAAEDRVLTLSTCSYEISEGRFVVHGILEEYVAEEIQDTAD